MKVINNTGEILTLHNGVNLITIENGTNSHDIKLPEGEIESLITKYDSDQIKFYPITSQEEIFIKDYFPYYEKDDPDYRDNPDGSIDTSLLTWSIKDYNISELGKPYNGHVLAILENDQFVIDCKKDIDIIGLPEGLTYFINITNSAITITFGGISKIDHDSAVMIRLRPQCFASGKYPKNYIAGIVTFKSYYGVIQTDLTTKPFVINRFGTIDEGSAIFHFNKDCLVDEFNRSCYIISKLPEGLKLIATPTKSDVVFNLVGVTDDKSDSYFTIELTSNAFVSGVKPESLKKAQCSIEYNQFTHTKFIWSGNEYFVSASGEISGEIKLNVEGGILNFDLVDGKNYSIYGIPVGMNIDVSYIDGSYLFNLSGTTLNEKDCSIDIFMDKSCLIKGNWPYNSYKVANINFEKDSPEIIERTIVITNENLKADKLTGEFTGFIKIQIFNDEFKTRLTSADFIINGLPKGISMVVSIEDNVAFVQLFNENSINRDNFSVTLSILPSAFKSDTLPTNYKAYSVDVIYE